MSETWPPPADESTVWEEMRLRTSRHPPSFETVRVREVLLWGKPVKINRDDDVWCPNCQRFRPGEALAAPDNACPVGLPARRGPWVVSEEELLADTHRTAADDVVDWMRGRYR